MAGHCLIIIFRKSQHFILFSTLHVTAQQQQRTPALQEAFIYLYSFDPYKVKLPIGYGTCHVSIVIYNISCTIKLVYIKVDSENKLHSYGLVWLTNLDII